MWLHGSNLNKEESYYFMTVARALALCQNFESNLRTLALEACIKLKSTPDNEQPSFDSIIETVKKKSSTVFKMIDLFGKAYSCDDFKTALDKARIARNQIAHCSLQGSFRGGYGMGVPMNPNDMIKEMRNPEMRIEREHMYISKVLEKKLAELKSHVYDLAIGDFYAGIIEWNVNSGHDSLPYSPESYADKILAWVFTSSTEIMP